MERRQMSDVDKMVESVIEQAEAFADEASELEWTCFEEVERFS
jgi:hypothetical protein